ncbi:MAG: nucleotide pyrophosphohydrolase [Spirochaetales bacterium]|jgi:dCTP diphosphatase|nr:nucleotide pyrophosphohydrolase [Spirochaetales bacterium]
MASSDQENLTKQIRSFTAERDWQQFHSPKNLAMALSVEVAEIVEIFQWLNQEQSRDLDNAKKAHLAEEIGDVMIYLTNLADKFGIDPIDAAKKKMVLNIYKYPADKARGTAKKYNEL